MRNHHAECCCRMKYVCRIHRGKYEKRMDKEIKKIFRLRVLGQERIIPRW